MTWAFLPLSLLLVARDESSALHKGYKLSQGLQELDPKCFFLDLAIFYSVSWNVWWDASHSPLVIQNLHWFLPRWVSWYMSLSGDVCPLCWKWKELRSLNPSRCQSVKCPHSCEAELHHVLTVTQGLGRKCWKPSERQVAIRTEFPSTLHHQVMQLQLLQLVTARSVGQTPRPLLLVKSFAFPRETFVKQFNPLK